MITFHPANEYWQCLADIRVNTVNCKGVMGKGLAKHFKIRFPSMFRAYQGICKGGKLKPGYIHEYIYNEQQHRIWNLATKDDWRSPSQYRWIEQGLKSIVAKLEQLPTGQNILIPALGCGNGGLQWTKVKEMIERQLTDLPHHIYVFKPEKL